MKFRIRYQVRGAWTVVDVTRLDMPEDEPDVTKVIAPNGDTEPAGIRGRALFRTYEWNLLYGKLGFMDPIGLGGEREIEVP